MSRSTTDPVNDFADLSGRRACWQFDDDVLNAEDNSIGGENRMVPVQNARVLQTQAAAVPGPPAGNPAAFSTARRRWTAPRFDGQAAAFRAGDGVALLLHTNYLRSLFHGSHPSRCVYFLERSKKHTIVFSASILPYGFLFHKHMVSLSAYPCTTPWISSLCLILVIIFLKCRINWGIPINSRFS